jgi:hypothetical protein
MSAWLDWVRLNWLLVAFVLALVLVFVFLRTRPTEGIDSLQSLDVTVDAGQPVVLEFYSNF